VGFIAIALPLLAIGLVSWLLHYFVALTEAPARRAAWTVGIAYVVVSFATDLAMPPEYWWSVPLAAIPGAIIAFWWWKDDFGRAWIDDAQGIPEGVELANEDWQIGLIFVGGIIVFFVLRFLIRLAGADVL